MPLILYDTSGNETFNTDTAVGGVIADVKSYSASGTGVTTYPAFTGRTAYIVNLLSWTSTTDIGVAVDTTLGYPRVTVSARSAPRKYAVVVV
jgi:hypothetical protein